MLTCRTPWELVTTADSPPAASKGCTIRIAAAIASNAAEKQNQNLEVLLSSLRTSIVPSPPNLSLRRFSFLRTERRAGTFLRSCWVGTRKISSVGNEKNTAFPELRVRVGCLNSVALTLGRVLCNLSRPWRD